MDINSQLACEKIYTIVFLKDGCQAKNVMVRNGVALYTGLSSVVLILIWPLKFEFLLRKAHLKSI